MFFLDNQAMLALKKDLDVGTLRQRVIANNVANVNTPGFKKYVVSFEDQFRAALGKDGLALRTTDPRHIGGVKPIQQVEPTTMREENTSLRPDGNNVDMDEEMVNLAANQVDYQTSSQALGDYYSLYSYIINSGR